MTSHSLNAIDSLQIEPLSDELLESVSGATSTGPVCCSCSSCTGSAPIEPTKPTPTLGTKEPTL